VFCGFGYSNVLPKMPAMINAGDGHHSHPTHEYFDQFTFLEQLGWCQASLNSRSAAESFAPLKRNLIIHPWIVVFVFDGCLGFSHKITFVSVIQLVDTPSLSAFFRNFKLSKVSANLSARNCIVTNFKNFAMLMGSVTGAHSCVYHNWDLSFCSFGYSDLYDHTAHCKGCGIGGFFSLCFFLLQISSPFPLCMVFEKHMDPFALLLPHARQREAYRTPNGGRGRCAHTRAYHLWYATT